MQKIIGTAIVALGALLAVGSGNANAAPDTLKVNVPFAFTVKGQTYQPGTYKVERDDQNPSIVRIVGDKRVREQVIIVTIPAAGHDPAGEKPALTFDRDGTQYELKGIWESASDGREVIERTVPRTPPRHIRSACAVRDHEIPYSTTSRGF